MRIYVSSGMRGRPKWGMPEIQVAVKILRELGHTVISPAEDELGNPLNPDLAYSARDIQGFFRYDISAILSVDAIVVLDGWMYSKGCQLEVAIAKAIGIPVMKFAKQAELWGDLIPEEDVNPVELAAETVRVIMGKGLEKHSADSWKEEPLMNHVLKAARHSLTAQLQAEGLAPLDNENHLENAVCRSVMALAHTKANL